MNESRIKCWDTIAGVLPYKARQVWASEGVSFVLLDADQYLGDVQYRSKRKAGSPALRNLWAFDSHGNKLWEAELPESNDYYYEIVDVSPLIVRSFSGYTCELEIHDGTITSKDFHK